MPIAHVQTAQANDAAETNFVEVAQASNPTAGNMNSVWVRTANIRPVSTVTDTRLNTYTLVIALSDTNQTGYRIELWRAFNITGGGANTVRATFSDVQNPKRICVIERSGVLTTNPNDQTASAMFAGAVPDPGTITPTQDNELIEVGAVTDGGAFTPLSGWTQRLDQVDGVGARIGVADLVQTAAAAVTDFWTAPTGANGAAIAASFKAAAGGGADFAHRNIVLARGVA